MIDYNELEQQISDILCPKLTDEHGVVTELNLIYDAKPLPDNESEYTRSFTKPIVFIAFVGSEYDSPINLGLIVQTETITFEAIIRAKTRRGTSGIFAVINDIKSKLLGKKLDIGFTEISLIKNGFIDSRITQNDWNYMLSFSTTTKAIENLPKPDYPTFQQIDTNG